MAQFEDALTIQDMKEAINRLLDNVERPVGTQAFRIPDTQQARLAISELYDVVGRNI